MFARIAKENAFEYNFEINGNHYDQGYYLVDGISSHRAVFVKIISIPQLNKRSLFAQQKESVIKDLEQTFGMLQTSWDIVLHPIS
jgi:hypothetical protein